MPEHDAWLTALLNDTLAGPATSICQAVGYKVEDPNQVPEGQEFTVNLNPNSLQLIPNAKLEPILSGAKAGELFQFERLGYFCADKESTPERLIFNRTVALRDTWAKVEKKSK